jgi:hypothetical protein
MNRRKEPETNYDFVLDWMHKASKVAKQQGRNDSASLWDDAIKHLDFLKKENDRLEYILSDKVTNDPKQYILLRDTYGRGLEQFQYHKLEIYSKDELAEAFNSAIDEIIEEDGYDNIEEYYKYLGKEIEEINKTKLEGYLYNQVVVCELRDIDLIIKGCQRKT